MMFSGPQAASPPKKTPGRVLWYVTLSTTGMSQSPNSMPMSRSIHGKALSCPMARITASHGMITVSITVLRCLPFASTVHSSCSNSIPTSLPSSSTIRRGAWFSMISISSSSASSSSHGDALKCLRPRRATTFTSVAPKRLADRQQSMAVLPTPMIRTRGSIFSTCPKCTLASHSIPMWTCAGASQRPGMSSSLPFGAPLPTKTASYSSSSSAFMLSTGVPYFMVAPMSMM